ncbi:MAG: M20 family metallopeptidase [Nitrososphaerota archaeon]
MKDILDKLEENVDDILKDTVSFLKEMIKVPTENPPGLNYETFLNLFRSKLDQLGYSTRLLEVPENQLRRLVKFGSGKRSSVIGVRGQGKIRVAFNGHYDVVPAGDGWRYNPFKPKISNKYIYGRGASDMKSGLSMQVFAVELLNTVLLNMDDLFTITQIAVPDEETVGNQNAGTYFVVDQGIISKKNTDFVIFTEPLGIENICYGHRGALLLTVKVRGKKSHGAMGYLGKDTISLTCELISKINKYAKEISSSKESSYNIIPAESKRPGLIIGNIHCGTWVNTVSDTCEFSIFRRLIPEEKLSYARKELLGIIRDVRDGSGYEIKVAEQYSTRSIIESTDNEYYESFKKAIKEVTQKNPNLVISPGTFDMRFTHRAGIPSLNYGPGILQESHMNDEKCSLDDLRKSLVITALALYNLQKIKYK